MHDSGLSHREKLEARLLLYRGCVKVYIQRLRAGVVLVADAGTQQQSAKQKQNRKSLWGFPWAWSALARRQAIPWLLSRFRDFERPVHAPRSPAGIHTCTAVYRWGPCMPRSREREKTRVRKRKCLYSALKSQFHTRAYIFLVMEMVWCFKAGSVGWSAFVLLLFPLRSRLFRGFSSSRLRRYRRPP